MARCFIVRYRDSEFNHEGRIVGRRAKPLVESTLRDANSNLATSFWSNNRSSPFHLKEGTVRLQTIQPSIKELLKAFGMKDPPTNRQKALTGKMLKDLLKVASFGWLETKHAIDLTIGAFFFAMRSCKFSLTKRKGRTVPLELGHVTFRDKSSNVVAQEDPDLTKKAKFVTVYFLDQKNGVKGDRRIQQKIGLELCPVAAWANVCQRVRATLPEANADTKVCSLRNEEGQRIDISSIRIAALLKNLCKVFGKSKGYGISHEEVGTRLIRSGAAMALFLMDHSIEKIKILGRWSSDAFMVYIRPQVLEWTNLMAKDMAGSEGFKDLNERMKTQLRRDDTRTQREHIHMPRFYTSS